MSDFSEFVDNIPAGVCACLLNKIDVTICKMSPKKVVLRVFEVPKEGDINLVFKCFSWGKGYEDNGPYKGKTVNITRREFWSELTISIDDARFTEMFYRLTRMINEYVVAKVEAYDNGFSQKLVDYPADMDEEFSSNYDEWMKKQEASFKISKLRDYVCNLGVELAVSLDNPVQYEDYINDRIKMPFSRVYIGNAYCHLLMPQPDMAITLLEKSKNRGVQVTLVLGFLREEIAEKQIAYLDRIIRWSLENSFEIEYEINDCGWIEVFTERKLNFSLGRLLNKRRKDPRYVYKDGLNRVNSYMKSNSLNDADYMEWLQGHGMTRVETESCGYEMSIPEIQTSLHIPMYQTNTSQMCPLAALIETGNRGKQCFKQECKMYCLEHAILYPDHLALIGKYNSIFALDKWLIQNYEIIKKYVAEGVDRILWNLD